MKITRQVGYILIISIAVIAILFVQKNKMAFLRNAHAPAKSPYDKAIEICGVRCPKSEPDLFEIRSVIERPDGVVVLEIPYNNPILMVIDTKRGQITDETGGWPYYLIGDVIVTSGQGIDLSYLRVLCSNKTTIEMLADSRLAAGETYDSGERQDYGPSWNIAKTKDGFSTGVYREDFTAPPFKKIGERTFNLAQ